MQEVNAVLVAGARGTARSVLCDGVEFPQSSSVYSVQAEIANSAEEWSAPLPDALTVHGQVELEGFFPASKFALAPAALTLVGSGAAFCPARTRAVCSATAAWPCRRSSLPGWMDANHLVCEMPAGALPVGRHSVRLAVNGGAQLVELPANAASALDVLEAQDAFAGAVSPAAGPASGGSRVRVVLPHADRHFSGAAAAALSCSFGGRLVAAERVSSSDDGALTLECVAPALPDGAFAALPARPQWCRSTWPTPLRLRLPASRRTAYRCASGPSPTASSQSCSQRRRQRARSAGQPWCASPGTASTPPWPESCAAFQF